MATPLQKEMKTLLIEMDALSSRYEGEIMPEAEAKSFKDKLARAEEIKGQIDQSSKAEALKAWANAPDGQSAVMAGFSRPAMPDEGNISAEQLKSQSQGAYKDAFVKYLRAAAKGQNPDQPAMKVLQEGIDNSGGFFVPPEYRTELIKKMATLTAVRPNAFTFTTGSELVKFPRVKYTTDQKYTSGVRFAWTAEAPAAAIGEATNPIAGTINIPIHTATAAVYVTRALMEDASFDILGYVTELIGEAYALGEEDAFLNGTGAGSPDGILNDANVAIASGTTDGMYIKTGGTYVNWGSTVNTTSAGVTTGLVGLEAALPPQYEANAKFLANKATYAAYRGLTSTTGVPLWNANDAWPNFANGMAAHLLGYPILKSQFMPDIAASAYPMLFGDFKGYFIADRVGLSIEVLREIVALQDMVVIYARKRLGGQLVKPWMLKAMYCSN